MVSSETEGPELDWEEMTFIPWKGRTPGVQGVVNGTKATSGQFPAVVNLGGVAGPILRCFARRPSSRPLGTHGGTLSDDVDDLQSQGYNLRVFFGHDIINVGPEAQIQWESYVSHPNWSGEIESGADIGLVKMVTKRSGLTPMVVNDETLTSAWYSKDIRFVGYGITKEGRNDSGVKRLTDIPFEGADNVYLYAYSPSTNICSGDSGGAALEQTSQGYELAGVNSFTLGDV